ncbi:zinc finger protein [Trichonephila clavipes]|nr:zinc finger protein [Trichonephila clavipes]
MKVMLKLLLPPDASELTGEDEEDDNEVNTEGYCDNFSLYCDKKSDARTDTPLDTWVMMKLRVNFVNPLSYTLYFGNFFTSIDLLKSLGEEGFRATENTYEKFG